MATGIVVGPFRNQSHNFHNQNESIDSPTSPQVQEPDAYPFEKRVSDTTTSETRHADAAPSETRHADVSPRDGNARPADAQLGSALIKLNSNYADHDAAIKGSSIQQRQVHLR